ncbi:uncharacterized protein EAF02_004543 [Botrytis sinoallii]|uniref:Cyclin N-terminal domain-containing protein n=2 Tax=Botrytis TaxID=33196 RepID=A0A4Z1IEW9_9HELO|nr:uncharacterized protein EAF02_004543 [Botrytis sinoallii]XP_038813406.1 uncharacterized protein EAE98_002048 [Botrytis deweyae]KAF7918036.1 hypothetical protein EAE99_009023 [Botrytis elliptica]KAF7884207.1 hypothetical protein EAF02_004543 [Botrytis sinoallii]KAF7935828.1 hypothetical protein EAE98_002048 [Botrytis deweyae]TGO57620.1 hypothetical protein BELL_1335g00010 [Botrytis elliptica]
MVPGGVCAHLEYQIEDMTDYVAEMTQRLVDPHTTTVAPEFRKFVLGLLSSTRLPHTTILLGMNYLSNRIQQHPKIVSRGGSMWRLLTVGLLLGSKFLDDNTFQNKSWSEVSGIAVTELNNMEHAWLEAIEWNLYVDLDNSDAYQAWLANWSLWSADRKKVKAATLERLSAPPTPLAPIDTNVSRRPSNANYRGYPKSATQERQQYIHYEHPAWANHSYPTPQHTPPSAPDSGVTTPEYLSATSTAPQYDWNAAAYSQYAKACMAAANAPYVMPDMSTRFHNQWPHHYSPHHYSPSHYFHQYSLNIWNPQPSEYSSQGKQQYFMPHHAYGGHQAVVG